jgi:ABC-type branched-subunit amino acid transport system ATPase component
MVRATAVSPDGDSATPQPLVVVSHLVAGYGSGKVLDDVSLSIERGSVLAVLGANGAGKSTLAGCLSGLVRDRQGRIEIGGVDVSRWPAHRMARVGVAPVLEGRGTFTGLSVMDNLRLAVRASGRPKQQRRDAIERAFDLFPVLAERRRSPASTLSGGQRQMLAVARVLVAPPTLLIADELSLGLAPKLVSEIFEILGQVRDAGTTIVLIEQYVERALDLADRAIILRRGAIAWEGAADAAASVAVGEYLGAGDTTTATTSLDEVAPGPAPASAR